MPSARLLLASVFTALALAIAVPAVAQDVDYLVVATSKTSTMEKELNGAATEGFRFGGVMGGETAFGGKEVLAIMSRAAGAPKDRYKYKLLATSKTSTMQNEIQDAGEVGYEYKGQTVFESLFGGKEVVIILERDKEAPGKTWQYKLLATSKTATMQKELTAAGDLGYEYVGVTVAQTAMGGNEVVVITRKPGK